MKCGVETADHAGRNSARREWNRRFQENHNPCSVKKRGFEPRKPRKEKLMVLMPCNVCGSGNVEILYLYKTVMYQARCGECKAQDKPRKTIRTTIELWNDYFGKL